MDSSSISDPEEVDEVSEYYYSDIESEISAEIPPHVSIFQLPESITTNKPEAYKPQHVGFGPYHHVGSGSHTQMLQQKVVQLQTLLRDGKIDDIHGAIIDEVEELVPVIQYCYETFPEDDIDSLALVFAVDGLFLLDLLDTNVDPALAQDIMMLENQIPFMVLEKVNEASRFNFLSSVYRFLYQLFTSFSPILLPLALIIGRRFYDQLLSISMSLEVPSSSNNFSPSIFRSFCERYSPFMLCSPYDAPTHVEHLLHYMYLSIIYYPSPLWGVVDNNTRHQVAELSVNELGETEIEQTMDSASKLERAGFRFRYLPKDRGIENIYILVDEVEMHLASITLENSSSEVILRNLVAYETFKSHTGDLLLTEYIGLMCELIVNVEDVEVLRRENIVKGDLGDAEVANMFVRMSVEPAIREVITRSDLLQKLRNDANKVYEISRPMMRKNWCCLF